MTTTNTNNQNRRPLAALDSTVIAIPLLKTLAGDKKGTKVHRVIVEINLLHPRGRIRTKDHVMAMIRELSGEQSVHENLASDSDQYVFASMSTTQIQQLARQDEEGRAFTTGDQNVLSDSETRDGSSVYKIWPDFEADLLLNESVATVKADAARAAFAATGRGVTWAVIDSGVDGHHVHFKKHRNLEVRAPLTHWDFSCEVPTQITDSRNLRDPIGHGTHVAGIIAGENIANGNGSRILAEIRSRNENNDVRSEILELDSIRGVAPETKIVSLRVANDRGGVLASSIIAALGYIRRINGDGRLPRIHGANISLGHPFDPEWFGCGQSPLCVEVERLVRSGTVVVVAAGNGGYGTISTKYKGLIEAGIECSIWDPANAGLAITVGATHRYMPHIYGVSFFSAKGPTGDGRSKPDLVAPGEKIISALSGQKQAADHKAQYIEDSGTSMAAPHVSGCIAAFLSIRREFKNQPERVKEIFLSTATDLGREKYYQGHGLVDLMRAVQSV